MDTREFTVGEDKYKLTSRTVEIVNTDSRSDTHVHGGGFVSGSVNNGTGSIVGASHVGSTVSVVRNIWYKNNDGTEAHWAAQFDLPVRAGHHMQIVHVEGPRTASYVGEKYVFKEKIFLGVQINELGKFYKVDGFDRTGKLTAVAAEPYYNTRANTLINWCLGIVGVIGAVFIFGLVLLAILLVRVLMAKGKINKNDSLNHRAKVLEALQNELNSMLLTN